MSFYIWDGSDMDLPEKKKTSGAPDETVVVRKLTLVGILGNILLTIFKLIAGILGNSMALISDAVHSLSDVVATFVAFIGAKMARKKPDANHQYGHERFECLAAVVLSMVLFGAAVGIGYAGVAEIITGEYEDLPAPTMFALVAVIVSIISKEAMYHYTIHYARLIGSQAFEADAWHHRSDAISSIGALIGIAASMLGYPIMDAVASIAICLILLKVAVSIALEAIRNVMDTSRGHEYEEVMSVFVENVPAVRKVDLLRTRMFGSKTFVDLEIALPPDMTLIDAHEVAEEVRQTIEWAFDDVKDVMVHVNPDLQEA